jgi:hypothetical protein
MASSLAINQPILSLGKFVQSGTTARRPDARLQFAEYINGPPMRQIDGRKVGSQREDCGEMLGARKSSKNSTLPSKEF